MEHKSKYLRIVKVGEKYKLFNIKQGIDLGFTIERVRVGRFMHWCLFLDKDCYLSAGCQDEVREMTKKLNAKISKKTNI